MDFRATIARFGIPDANPLGSSRWFQSKWFHDGNQALYWERCRIGESTPVWIYSIVDLDPATECERTVSSLRSVDKIVRFYWNNFLRKIEPQIHSVDFHPQFDHDWSQWLLNHNLYSSWFHNHPWMVSFIGQQIPKHIRCAAICRMIRLGNLLFVSSKTLESWSIKIFPYPPTQIFRKGSPFDS